MSELKRKAAEKAVEFVEDGMTLGLGTGSTTFFAIEAIGSLVGKGYHLRGVPTSVASEEQARKCGIPLVSLDEVDRIDLTIDGADEVDGDLNLIKGMGGRAAEGEDRGLRLETGDHHRGRCQAGQDAGNQVARCPSR